MSADNLVYLQRCLDGKWRAWEQSASVDAARPAQGFIAEADTREAAIVAAFDWDQQQPTEYGLAELPAESGSERAMTDRELLVACFERILEDWKRIDGEWGPADGGLEGAIARGEETLIQKIRKHLAEPPSA